MILIGCVSESSNYINKHNISIINLSGTVLKGDNIHHIQIKDKILSQHEIEDIVIIIFHIIKLIDALLLSNYCVLIICKQGINRSSLILASYILITYGGTPWSVITYVKRINYEHGRSALTNMSFNRILYIIWYMLTKNKDIPNYIKYKEIKSLPNSLITIL